MTVTLNKGSLVFQAKISDVLPQLVSGEGIRLRIQNPSTGEATEVLDGVTGAAVGALGWGDEKIRGIMAEAAQQTSYSFPAVFGNPYAEKLAEFYINNSPAGSFAAALWTCSGSESNENALKIIRQYFMEQGKVKKTKFISRKTSYHGYTIGALSIGSSLRSLLFQEILLPVNSCLKMEPFYPYRNKKNGETLEQYSSRLLNELESMIIAEDPETIAAIIVETLPGSALGTSVPTSLYMRGLRTLCDKYDIIFMLDEVMCGTGRSNPNGGLNCWECFLPPNEGPDIQTVGKTLGSGYVTIAGVLISPKVRDVFVNGSNNIIGAQTYSSHAFNCYVSLEVQKRIKELKLTENIFKIGNYMGDLLNQELSKYSIVGDVRGIGGFWSVEFVKDKESKEVFPVECKVASKLQNICFENGLTVMGVQGCADEVRGDHISLAPSFVVTEEDVNEMVQILSKSIQSLEDSLREASVI